MVAAAQRLSSLVRTLCLPCNINPKERGRLSGGVLNGVRGKSETREVERARRERRESEEKSVKLIPRSGQRCSKHDESSR